MTTARRRRRAAAAATGLLLLPALVGCFDQRRQSSEPSGSPAETRSPSGAPTVALVATATPTPPSTSARPTRVVIHPPPVIRALTASPDRVDPLGCKPPDPPERPEVIVRVDAPGLDVAASVVTLSYWVSGSEYRGEVRMRYDRARKAFVDRLPPVTGAAFGPTAHGITLYADAAHPAVQPGTAPPPTRGWIALKGRCFSLRN
ncbi:hypothetical protein [Micromonospora echinaurantiaca]|uniref:hypothetical protein n=1 Tax=Micromonospora echinaurantiaca TaxID=47857 RepID=UPI003449D51B